MKLMKFIILFSALLITTCSTVSKNDDIGLLIQRLPNDTVPYHYTMKILPNIVPGNFTFDAESEILFGVLKSTRNLTVSALSLTFRTESTTVFSNGEKFVPSRHVVDEVRQFLILSFENELQPGNYTLHLEYYGRISIQTLNSFYISYYKNDSGDTTFLATTHFEATRARQAFPCWDEPALKATFDISIKHFPNYTALSNMPIEKIINDTEIDGKLWTNFKSTRKMSTYLICFVISDFKNISNNYGNFSVWSRKNALNSVRYMFDVGTKVLRSLEEYTNISYAFPKLDNIVIPHSPSSATENWGLITYRESGVLLNDKSPTSKNLSTALLVAHEYSHQWFGNLVGPAWWKDLWLNEGFARYMQYIIMDKIMCNERIMELGAIKITDTAFEVDSIDDTLPVSPKVEDSMSLHKVFFRITYEKGATLLHMLSNFLSEEIFHKGIIKYLQANKFKSATADDLWKSMQEALNESKVSHSFIDIKKVMDPYIYRKGYPIINVTRNYTTGMTTLTQKCFVCLKMNNIANADEIKWWVPINFATNRTLNFSSTLATHWMNPEAGSLHIEGIDVNDWIIINLKQSAYYRVQYDRTNWKKIVNYLKTENYSKVHALNRAKLLADAFDSYKSDELDLGILLELLSYLVQEVDYVPWMPAIHILHYLSAFFEGTSIYPEFQRFGLHLISAFITDVGFDKRNNETLFTSLARDDAFFLSSKFGHDLYLKKAKDYISEFISHQYTDKTTYDYQDWILCKGLEDTNETIWNKVFAIYNKTKDSIFINALSCVKKENILQSFLEITTSNDTHFSKYDSQAIFQSVLEKNFGLAWRFFIENFNQLKRVFDCAENMIHIINRIVRGTRTTTQMNEVKEFLKKNPDFVENKSETQISERENFLTILHDRTLIARAFFKENLQ
ncbi:aminopeptidase N-like isoform X2 [Belonocnema kinseyi]|uniref:aminopeptidase N-like isoform X2 n=1 Tax=Belonocnema kinseyi TaxID=2817044 RepID=UPI00143D4388|nr:aminopeptidase N-like isoform X2 [Belonocnema kinseyi]